MSRIMLAALGVLLATSVSSQEAVVRGQIELEVALESRALSAADADVVFVPVFADEDPGTSVLADADAAVLAAVETARSQKLFTGKLHETLPLLRPEGMASPRLVLVGAGAEAAFDHEQLRRLAGAAARGLRSQSVSSMALFLRGRLEPEVASAAVTEGAILGLYDAGLHKTGDRALSLKTLRIGGAQDSGGTREAIARAKLEAEAVNFARALVAEPANYLTPELLAQHARTVAREGSLEVEILDEHAIREKGMGGVMAVGQGSANPPRFIALRYRPAAPSEVTLAFVGKGVCFDTGGISLKGGSGMYRMKGDMAGGATVLGVMKIVAALKPAVNVMGIVPAVENMPGPRAQKPGDVFVGYSGKTVEVMSTDAEGRLILSDGIAYAVEQGATHVVDIATLTGTVRRALGDRHVGAFSNDDALFAELQRAASRTGESFWRLPIDEDYARGIKSSLVADLNETGGDAGASVGAKFIEQFVEGRPWIHLDIAGLSWPAYTPPYRGAGPTGVTVRTLAELAMRLRAEGATN